MKRKRQTRFAPIQKVEPVGRMVAGDRRKMMEAHQQAMREEALLCATLLAVGVESLNILRQLSRSGESLKTQEA